MQNKVAKEEYSKLRTQLKSLYGAVSKKGKVYKEDLDKSTFRKDTNAKGGVIPRNHVITPEHRQLCKNN